MRLGIILTFFGFLFFISGCSPVHVAIEKRKFNKGFYVDVISRKNPDGNAAVKTIASKTKKKFSVNEPQPLQNAFCADPGKAKTSARQNVASVLNTVERNTQFVLPLSKHQTHFSFPGTHAFQHPVSDDGDNDFWRIFLLILLCIIFPFLFPVLVGFTDDGLNFSHKWIGIVYSVLVLLSILMELGAIIAFFFFPVSMVLLLYLAAVVFSVIAFLLFANCRK